jgi:hypothetical protein
MVLGTDAALSLGMTPHANRATRAVRCLVPDICALIASAAGCGGLGADDPPTVGLASVTSASLEISHGAGNTNLHFVAEVTLPGGTSCPPPLAPDFAITVNGTPMQLSLLNDSDAITFTCPSYELDGFATLPETGGPLDVELTQGGRKASMTIARSAFPAIGPVALSRTAVSVGESFAVNVAVSGADVGERQQLAVSNDWIASLCDPSGCVPGQGWIGLVPTNAGVRDGGLGFDVVVPDTVPTGTYLLDLHLFQPTILPTITECSGIPSCMAYNSAEQSWDFGPFVFDVL